MPVKPLTVVWISDFTVEWLPDLPEPLRVLPQPHPATWQLTLLSELAKDPSLRLEVVALRKEMKQDYSFERNGVRFHVLKTLPLLRAGSLFWLDTLLMKRLFARIKPDVVHAWGTERGAPQVARRLGYPYVATIQGLLSWYQEVVPLTKVERFQAWLERRSIRHAPIVTGESAFTVQYLKAHYPDRQVHHIEHVPSWAFHRVRRRPASGALHFISNGTLGYRKGTDLLLRALDSLAPTTPFRLTLICGPNQHYIDSLSSTVSEELRKRIEFKHNLPPDEVPRELETPTMMLMPTRVDTGPMAVKEAAVAGVPAVASNIGGVPDYIVDGRNGLMFPAGDLSAFVRAIKTACAHPLFSKGLVEPDTLTRSRAYLSPERMAQGFLGVYRAALANSGASLAGPNGT